MPSKVFLFMRENDNILKKIFQPNARGRVWQIFVFIMILAFIGGLIDGGQFYNKGVDWLSSKTGQAVSLPKVSEKSFHLGLDLQGGSHLIYQADMSAVSAADRTNSIEGVRDVIERRVNVFGVSEPVVQTNVSGGNYRVVVELAGVSDVNEAIKMIGETPLLEFKEQSAEARTLTESEQKTLDAANAEAEAKAEEVLGKLNSNGDFAAIATQYSQNDATKSNGGDLGWITSKDNAGAVSAVENFKVGEYTKKLSPGASGYTFYKLEDKRAKTNPFNENQTEKEVRAAHLLICYDGIEDCASGLTKDQAYEKIKSIGAKATAKNFTSLVKEFTTEPGGKDRGGELGWFTSDAMVAPFSDAVFAQKVGTISYVVETKFGYHLIYKEAERDVYEYKVRDLLIRTVTASDIIGDTANWKNTELTGKNLKRASVQFNPNDSTPEVSLEFDSEGAQLFEDVTGRNVGKPVAIFLDGLVISAPNVNQKITGGKAVISGNFSLQEAKLLAQRLNAGALPVPITLVSQQKVGASLGQSSLDSSLIAGLAGMILVALFMIIFYRLPGLLSVFALIIYGILSLAIFKLWPVTLTLSGLAGFIMSIGMAVDANILIFSRLREELASGRQLGLALEEGFRRAWPSIRDSNISTLITCFILIEFTTSIIKGFAITLALGVIVSMFSAIFITRNFLKLIPENWLEKKHWLIGGKTTNNTKN